MRTNASPRSDANMNHSIGKYLLSLAMICSPAILAGCHEDKPHEYGRERPPIGELDPRDRGLQSKDVVAASDKMAMDLLADPNLNASHSRWTIVVDRVENKTVSNRFD